MNKVYDIITDRIIAELEKGIVPWRKPWQSDRLRGTNSPTNLVSMKAYRGINAFLLAMMPYSSPYWVTYKQATALGGNVRAGSKSTPVIFYTKLTVDDKTGKSATGKKQIPMLRYYSVFNIEQTEGIELPKPEAPIALPDFNPIDEAEKIVAGYPHGPRICGLVNEASYNVLTDVIGMPNRSFFSSPGEYYHTLFHEMTHSTGAKHRLDRELTGSFGSDAYAKEELIAEMGAAFLSGHAGMLPPIVQNSAAYIGNWLKRLRGDNKLVIQAAAQAQRAADYVLGDTKPDFVPEDAYAASTAP